jgi:hypothetical protein
MTWLQETSLTGLPDPVRGGGLAHPWRFGHDGRRVLTRPAGQSMDPGRHPKPAVQALSVATTPGHGLPDHLVQGHAPEIDRRDGALVI